MSLGSGQPLAPLTFTWRFDAPLPAGTSASFWHGDVETEGIELIPTTLSADRRTATAEVEHLSLKGLVTWVEDDLSRFAGEVFSTRGERPTCTGPVPSWVTTSIYVDQHGGDNPLLACVGDRAGDYLVTLVNNRGHGLVVDMDVRPRSVEYAGFGTDLGEMLRTLLDHTSGQLGGKNRIPLPPGQEVTLVFTQSSLVGTDPLNISAEINPMSLAHGMILWALDEALGEQAKGNSLLAAAALAHCATGLRTTSTSLGTWVRQTTESVACLTDVDMLTTLIKSALGGRDYVKYISFKGAADAKRLAKKLNAVLLVFSVAQQSLEIGASLLLPRSTFEVVTYHRATAPPPASAWTLVWETRTEGDGCMLALGVDVHDITTVAQVRIDLHGQTMVDAAPPGAGPFVFGFGMEGGPTRGYGAVYVNGHLVREGWLSCE